MSGPSDARITNIRQWWGTWWPPEPDTGLAPYRAPAMVRDLLGALDGKQQEATAAWAECDRLRLEIQEERQASAATARPRAYCHYCTQRYDHTWPGDAAVDNATWRAIGDPPGVLCPNCLVRAILANIAGAVAVWVIPHMGNEPMRDLSEPLALAAARIEGRA